MTELEARVAAVERALVQERARSRRRQGGLLGLCAVLLVAAAGPQILRGSRVELGDLENPSIVMGAGVDGPTLQLRDERGRLATLTAAGLVFEAPEPVDEPTFEEPGLEKVEVATTRFMLFNTGVSSVEVVCKDLNFRERFAAIGGQAILRLPPDAVCHAVTKGVGTPKRYTVEPGQEWFCEPGSDIRCRQTR